MSGTVIYEVRHRFMVEIGIDLESLVEFAVDPERNTRWQSHKGYRFASEAIAEVDRLAAAGKQARVVDRGLS